MELISNQYYLIAMFAAMGIALFNSIKKQYQNTYLTIILVVSGFTEVFATYLVLEGHYNTWLYNIYQLPEITIYLQVIKQFCSSKKAKRVIGYFQLSYIIIVIANITFLQGLFTYNTISYAFGSLLMLITCLYYFLELFRYKKQLNLKKEPSFWITTGLLFFYAVSFPHFVTINFQIKLFHLNLNIILGNLISVINIILYTLISIGLLCNYKMPKKTAVK